MSLSRRSFENRSLTPSNLSPNPTELHEETDSLVYFGPSVTESWLDRTSNHQHSNFLPTEGANGLHYSGITVGTVYGDDLDYVESNNSNNLLATSNEQITWPFDENNDPFWPGWLNDNGNHFSSQDVYLGFDDKTKSNS